MSAYVHLHFSSDSLLVAAGQKFVVYVSFLSFSLTFNTLGSLSSMYIEITQQMESTEHCQSFLVKQVCWKKKPFQ